MREFDLGAIPKEKEDLDVLAIYIMSFSELFYKNYLDKMKKSESLSR